MAMRTNCLVFNLTADEIKAMTDKIIADAKATHDKIATIPKGSHTWENTVKALEDASALFSTLSANVTFPSSVSPDKAARDASTAAKKTISEFSIDTFAREDLYQAIMAYKAKGEKLEPIDQRLLDKTVELFERNGLELSPEKREQLKTLKKRASELCVKANQAMNEECAKFSFTQEELAGLPADFIANLPRDSEGKILLSLKYPEYIPVQKHCTVEATRKKMETEFASRCQKENIPVLQEVIQLRHDAANLLGFPDHASYILKVRMAKNPATVVKFLDDLIEKLEKPLQQDVDKLLELKKADCTARGIPNDGQLNAWDASFYMNNLLEVEYKVNDNEISEYFPLDVVTEGIFQVYQELLGIKFKEIKGFPTWHPDVQLFEVYDAKTDEFIGQFYIDLFPRDGKYSHAAAFGLQQGYFLADGTWQYPAVALLANFTKPSETNPSLLKHSEVVTFFHELGHIFHQVCTKSKYQKFSGTNVERDFVEAPSQMLENWCWEKDVLRRISSHKTTKQPLPDDLLERMIKAKNASVGMLNRRQLFFGKFDLHIHTRRDAGDLDILYGDMRTKITKVLNTPGTNGAGAWGHIFGGYDASYYGYMWSEVYSCDMFSLFTEAGIMNKTLGERYRNVILKKGGTEDGMDLLKEFLGREPSADAFLKQKNIL